MDCDCIEEKFGYKQLEKKWSTDFKIVAIQRCENSVTVQMNKLNNT